MRYASSLDDKKQGRVRVCDVTRFPREFREAWEIDDTLGRFRRYGTTDSLAKHLPLVIAARMKSGVVLSENVLFTRPRSPE